jgi:hypothetical protein
MVTPKERDRIDLGMSKPGFSRETGIYTSEAVVHEDILAAISAGSRDSFRIVEEQFAGRIIRDISNEKTDKE